MPSGWFKQASHAAATPQRDWAAESDRGSFGSRWSNRASIAWDLTKQTFAEWNEDKVPRLGAALAYYSVFSLAPLLLIAIAIVGAVFGRTEAQGKIIGQVEGLIGAEAAEAVNKMLMQASRPMDGLVASLVGVVLLLFGATGVFGQLQDALNTIWKVAPKPGRGLRGFIRHRFLSLTVVAGTGFLLLVSLVISAVLAFIGELGDHFLGQLLGQGLNFVLSFAVTIVLFAMIYKILPDVRIGWADVWLGAALTALLFTVGKQFIGMYIGRSQFTSVFGAAGSIVVILIWVYYSSQLLLLGAEFTQVYANRYGSRILPKDSAISLTAERRIQQGIPRQQDIEEAVNEAPGGPAR